jgi:transposase
MPSRPTSARLARSASVRPSNPHRFTVAAFGYWLQTQRRKISVKAQLGEKLAYIHNHWDGLQTFPHDGRVEIDSNRVENLIRPIALNRKIVLFAGRDEGSIASGRIASLIESCKINGNEPFAYLKATLTAIANSHRQSHTDNMLPWNLKPSS